MKDAKGHGSNSRGTYQAATSAVAAHQTGVAGVVPTAAQFQKYRDGRRATVRDIVSAVKSNTIPLSPWAKDVIARARADHTASIGRQRGLL